MLVLWYQFQTLALIWLIWFSVILNECVIEVMCTKQPMTPVPWVIRDFKRIWNTALRPKGWELWYSLLVHYPLFVGPLIAFCLPYMFNLGERNSTAMLPMLGFQIMFVILAWTLWYFLFGVECYMNGLRTQNQFLLPFMGLRWDIYWLFHPRQRPEGWSIWSRLFTHSFLFLPPVAALGFPYLSRSS